MSGIAERLAEVLAEHVKECSSNGCEVCDCDDFEPEFGRVIADDEGWNAWLEHVAQALLPVVEREIAAARGEALREVADAWTQGGWADAMLPKPTHTAAPVIAYSNRIGDWLRDRAALSPDPDRGEGEA